MIAKRNEIGLSRRFPSFSAVLIRQESLLLPQEVIVDIPIVVATSYGAVSSFILMKILAILQTVYLH